MAEKRMDKNRKVLRKGESQRADGTYDYRWTTRNGKRHSVYAKTLDELREKEEQILKDKSDGIKAEASRVTLDDLFELWCDLKRGLKDNTFQTYKYMYTQFVSPDLGKRRVSTLKKSDIKRFYNMLADERNLKISTVDRIHTVLHQVLQIAVDDNYIRNNPSDNVLRELKQSHNFDTEKRKALTVDEQKLFLSYLQKNKQYNHWYPIFALMIGTGLRVGEATGLRWCDINLHEKEISVNHTLVYYKHAVNGCYFNVNTPKTKAGNRTVPMMNFVKQALIQERKNQIASGIKCEVTIDGYTDFIFVNRYGNVQHQGTLNKALRRIIRDCNDEVLEKGEKDPVLLPRFSCHNLRHTFTTRLIESGVNPKVVQDTLGHKDISTTLGIYADVTKDFKKEAFDSMQINSDVWAI